MTNESLSPDAVRDRSLKAKRELDAANRTKKAAHMLNAAAAAKKKMMNEDMDHLGSVISLVANKDLAGATQVVHDVLNRSVVTALNDYKKTVAQNLFVPSTESLEEEVEQLDELNKSTLKRYIHAASHDAARAGLAAGHDSANQHHAERKGQDIIAGAHGKSKAANIKKVLKRTSGILKATNRLEEAKLHVPLKGHDYHHKSDAELHYIAKDAKEAMDAIGTHDRKAANKYADQVNDAVSILAYRRKGGKQVVKPSNKIQEARKSS